MAFQRRVRPGGIGVIDDSLMELAANGRRISIHVRSMTAT